MIEDSESVWNSLRRENETLNTGYEKIASCKAQLQEEDETYGNLLKEQMSAFSPALNFVQAFLEKAKKEIDGEQNKRCFSLLQEALEKLRKQVLNNEQEMDRLRRNINSMRNEVSQLKVQLNSL